MLATVCWKLQYSTSNEFHLPEERQRLWLDPAESLAAGFCYFLTTSMNYELFMCHSVFNCKLLMPCCHLLFECHWLVHHVLPVSSFLRSSYSVEAKFFCSLILVSGISAGPWEQIQRGAVP